MAASSSANVLDPARAGLTLDGDYGNRLWSSEAQQTLRCCILVAGSKKGAKHARRSRFERSLSLKEFQLLAAQFHLQEPFLTLARRVLVDGDTIARVAESSGQPRSNVWFWCDRLDKARVPGGCELITLVVPSTLAKHFRAEASKAVRQLAKARSNAHKGGI